MYEVIDKVQKLAGPVDVVRLPTQRGDVRHTSADTARARDGFGYQPQVTLDEGLGRMAEAARARYGAVTTLDASR